MSVLSDVRTGPGPVAGRLRDARHELANMGA